ncbi:MAG: FAD binding domain-containing protein [Burkholderiales bacterium]|nr:FAD binding domain-containing protein [Burkholderiales bacterium]
MKAPPFAYRRASSVADACALLDAHGGSARILAGGQSLIPSLNLRLSQPELLIDISQLAELRGIRVSATEMIIGALTRHADIERSAEVRARFPALADAARQIAHPAIRNRGTIGGSIALADPAAEWPAAALAFDMRFTAVSTQGERSIAATEFFKGLYETALLPGEVLRSIHVPLPAAAQRAAFGELTRRSGDYAIAGAFVTASVTGGWLGGTRAAFFGVATRPLLAARAMRALDGSAGDAAAVAAARAHLEADLDPIADLYNSRATKLHLAGVLLARLVARLAAPGG